MQAAFANSSECVELLLGARAKIDACDKDKCMLLFLLCIVFLSAVLFTNLIVIVVGFVVQNVVCVCSDCIAQSSVQQ